MFRAVVAVLMAWTLAVAADEQPETIKVLIADGVRNPMVETTSGFRVFNPATQRYVGAGMRGKRYPVQATDIGLRWGEEYPSVYQISIMPRREDASIIVNGIQYQGIVHLYQIDGRISIVNEIPIEDYLRITLTEKFKEPRSVEVMAAVAIAARTHAFYDIENSSDAYWHVRAEEASYTGGLPTSCSGAVDQAVGDTQYMVMFAGDRSFPALWTEHCAGRTAPYKAMFGHNGDGLKGVESPLALQDREHSSWRIAVPTEWLARAARLNDIKSMSLYADPTSHKVYAVRFSDGARVQDINFFTLQEAIGEDKLRSSDFVAELKGGQIVFTGHGEGHGVGMCLFTAQRMARSGSHAAQILGTFYPSAEIVITRDAEAKMARRAKRPQPTIIGFQVN